MIKLLKYKLINGRRLNLYLNTDKEYKHFMEKKYKYAIDYDLPLWKDAKNMKTYGAEQMFESDNKKEALRAFARLVKSVEEK